MGRFGVYCWFQDGDYTWAEPDDCRVFAELVERAELRRLRSDNAVGSGYRNRLMPFPSADMVTVFALVAKCRYYPDDLGYEEQFRRIVHAWRPVPEGCQG